MAPLLSRLQPREQRQLARQIARDLRQTNTQRMRTQAGPRWPAVGAAQGHHAQRTRQTAQRAPVHPLAGPNDLKASGSPQEAVVQPARRAERIARVHHFGLRDRVKPGGPEYDYPARPLLGITPEFEEKLRDRILNHLARTSKSKPWNVHAAHGSSHWPSRERLGTMHACPPTPLQTPHSSPLKYCAAWKTSPAWAWLPRSARASQRAAACAPASC